MQNVKILRQLKTVNFINQNRFSKRCKSLRYCEITNVYTAHQLMHHQLLKSYYIKVRLHLTSTFFKKNSSDVIRIDHTYRERCDRGFRPGPVDEVPADGVDGPEGLRDGPQHVRGQGPLLAPAFLRGPAVVGPLVVIVQVFI